MRQENLENRYQAFLASLAYPYEKEYIDYVGMNLNSIPEEPCCFKMYYSDHCNCEEGHPLIDYLSEQGMLGYMEIVQDTGKKRFRCDIRLQNRTNENMEKLFDRLRADENVFAENEELIRRLAKMKITDVPECDMASMYFMGFVSGENGMELLKLHYINRYSEDPNVLYKNIQYRDEEYLIFLENSGVEEFGVLAERARKLLKECGGHLWMTGLDVDRDGRKKYKIYIKYPKNLMEGLRRILKNEDSCKNILEKAEYQAEWVKTHRELELEGVALCMDTDGVFSINYYYDLKSENINLGYEC